MFIQLMEVNQNLIQNKSIFISPLGLEISLCNKEYFGIVVSVKLHFSLELLPGHFDRLLTRPLSRIRFAIGMGRILMKV